MLIYVNKPWQSSSSIVAGAVLAGISLRKLEKFQEEGKMFREWSGSFQP